MVLLMISLGSGQNNITPPWAMLVFNLSGVITIFYSNAKIQNYSKKELDFPQIPLFVTLLIQFRE